MADNEILPAQSEATEEHGTIGLRGGDPNAPKPWCYLIVTPDPRNSTGATNYGATVVRQKWFVKFGDGNPTYSPDQDSDTDEDPALDEDPGDPKARYSTHNPSYFVTINKTDRVAKKFERPIFKARGFSKAGNSKEWYVVYENGIPVPPGLRTKLESLVTDFPTVNLKNPAQVTAFINRVIGDIPTSCKDP